MTNYFFDTEFLEGRQWNRWSLIPKITKPTIDLISIGIVDENGRSYYAISNEFNLKEAWNRLERTKCDNCDGFIEEYWIRDNVLLPIYSEFFEKERYAGEHFPKSVKPFSYKSMKTLIKWYGKANIQIANEICEFIYGSADQESGMSPLEMSQRFDVSDKNKEPVFYAYYASYDWVAFAWLFGRMIDLPRGFPKYCRDLKQMLDEKAISVFRGGSVTLAEGVAALKEYRTYPKQTHEHNALADAKWNYELYKFIQTL